MTQMSMTQMFAENAVSGTVIDVNELAAADTRSMIMDYALRAAYTAFPAEFVKVDKYCKGSFSVVKGTVICSVIDTYRVGVCIKDGGKKSICVKGKYDDHWHAIDSDIMDDAPNYLKAEKAAIRSGKKSHTALQVGDFILGTNEGSKESSVLDYLRWFASEVHDSFNVPCVCHIERIEELTDEELDSYDFMERAPEGFDGGSYSEDVPDDFDGCDFSRLTYAQRRSWIQRVCILRTPTRWVAVDPQGYSYSRYVHFPLQWRQMFSQDVEKAEQKEREYQAYLKAEQDKRDAEQQARYDERTERIMKATDGLKGVKAIDWDKKGYQTRCNNAVKRVLKALFPDTVFAVTKDYEWHSVEVSWTGGPNENEVRDILEAMQGDAWTTDKYDYSGYGGYIVEHRSNMITSRIGQLGRVRTYRHTA